MRFVSVCFVLSTFIVGCASVRTERPGTDPASGIVASEPAPRPNIIWIYTDDHAQQAISAYGSRINKTPNIDRIAAGGVIFDNSFVCNSICGPARAAVLTGKHSHANGFMQNGNKFNGEQLTFPKVLQKTGYETALIGKWHLGTDPTGFDHWEILRGQGHYYNPDFKSAAGPSRVEGYVTDIITDKALGWLESRDKEKPFMLMLQHKAPHRAWEPSPRHLTLYKDQHIPEPETLFDDYSNRTRAAAAQEMSIAKDMFLAYDLKMWTPDALDKKGWQYNSTIGRLTESQRAEWDAAYESEIGEYIALGLDGDELTRWKYQRYIKDYLRCIAGVDDSIGHVLDYLEENGLAKNTIVMYSSDQGFYLGEHGWYDKRWMYEESVRTPLVVRWPGGAKPGSHVTQMVQNIDMAATFVELAGGEVPAEFQGESLVPLLRGQRPKWRDSIYYHYYQGSKSTHKVHRHRGVRTERHKLIHFTEIDEWELFDLEGDPHELKSVYGDPAYAEIQRALEAELARLEDHYGVEG